MGMWNAWRTYRNEILVWEVDIPAAVIDPTYRRWERATLEAGEAHAVYRVEATTPVNAPPYRRDRDGYIVPYLDTHPEVFMPPDYPEAYFFSHIPVAAARLAYVDTTGQVREAETAYLSALPDLLTHFGNRKSEPPLQILAGDHPDGGSWATVSSYSTIWLPWQPNDNLDDDLPADALIDNRVLAERHTPRLNAFLADVAAAAQAAGGWLRLDRTETARDYRPFLTDNGVRLDLDDRPPPTPSPW